MTTAQIQKELAKSGKTVGLTQLYKYFDVVGILPQGVRQRPQIYPADSAERILRYLGFSTFSAHNGIDAVRQNFPMVSANGLVPIKTKNRVTAIPRRATGKIVSMKQLKRERKK